MPVTFALHLYVHHLCVLVKGTHQHTHRKFHHHQEIVKETVISTEYLSHLGGKIQRDILFSGVKIPVGAPLVPRPEPAGSRFGPAVPKRLGVQCCHKQQKSPNRLLAIFVKFSGGAHACGWQHWVYWSFLGDECCMLDRSVRREAAALSRS